MKAKTYSALQKAHDQAYLTCSTAAYYGSQGSEVEALRWYRECLAQLQGHNFAGHQPQSEGERTLLLSLKTMQEQCQERVGLLQALLISRVEAENSGQGLRNREPALLALLTPPPLPSRFPAASGTPSRRHSSSQRAGVSSIQPTITPATPPIPPLVPSPEKRVLLSTLRHSRKPKKSDSRTQNEGGQAAAKAATLAWSSLSRAEGAHLSRAMTAPSTTADSLPVRQSFVASASTSDLSLGQVQRFTSTFTVSRRPIPSSLTVPARPGVKSRPRSSILALGNNPPYPVDDTPPMPPPRDYYPPVGERGREHTRSLHQEAPEVSNMPPVIPPRVPPKHVAEASGSAPEGDDSDAEYYKPPANYRRTMGHLPPRDEEESPDEETEIPLDDGSEEGGLPATKPVGPGKRVEEAVEEIVGNGVNRQAAEEIANEIVVKGDEVHWDDIAGLETAKRALKEAVVYPFLRPDLFRGLRKPVRGMLLFGPPGTGKTMLARAVATESKSTFFSISASSLTSKYLGESEKLVRALFALAKAMAPSIIFVDEIDSLLCSRGKSGENEATRRIKTEFLIQWSDLDEAAAGKETEGDASRVLVLAATNLPWAIDEAARRRFVKRQYIPLPEDTTRRKHLQRLLGHQKQHLDEEEMNRLIELTEGFSGSDITALAKDAAMGPLRSLGEELLHMRVEDIRPIAFEDFEASLTSIRPSVSKEGIQLFEDWAIQFGERMQ